MAGGVAATAANGDPTRSSPGRPATGRSRPPSAATGGGTVLETEAGDDGAAYGVEIRLGDGH